MTDGVGDTHVEEFYAQHRFTTSLSTGCQNLLDVPVSSCRHSVQILLDTPSVFLH